MEERLSIGRALSAVMSELPAIGKDQSASQAQGGYAYRGIEQITRHVQGLFAKHGVVVIPAVQSIDVTNLLVNQKPWTDTTLVVNYTLVGPDGSQLQATTVGVGRDSADKGANKAMTQAFKYLLLQLLCISDAKDDADGQTHEADSNQAHPNAERVNVVLADFKRLPETSKEALRSWADGRALSGGSMIRDERWLGLVEDWLAEHENQLRIAGGS